MNEGRYTHYPRTILWLIPGGETVLGGEEDGDLAPSRAELEPFYISKAPITNEQFEAFDPGFLRAESSPGDRDPAVGVSLVEATQYAEWYAGVARKPFRLPTEAEWEHACRSGTTGRLFYDDPADADLYQWDAENSGDGVPILDRKKSNGFGLFGMLGGVWEWTASGALRGGSFRTPRAEMRCALRRVEAADQSFDNAGFRIVKNLR